MQGVSKRQGILVTLAAATIALAGCLSEGESGSDSAAVSSPGPGNSAPTISGTPPGQATVGNQYSFTPTANDLDGDALSFSVGAKPAWAAFNSTNGRLSGTPQSEHVGTYSNVTITVSDGSASATIGPFSILVKDTATGSVTLSWEAPTQNEDGSDLTDLDGYRLYWGTTPGSYTDSVTIDNESVLTYVVDNLPFGTYEFVATSFNTSGVESRYSTPVSKVVNQ